MKIQIRKSCFETNSSSMHAIVVTSKAPKTEYLEYDSIEFETGEFGWGHITYYDTYHKASYLWTCIINAFIISVDDEGTHKGWNGEDIQNSHLELDINNPEYIKRKEAIKNACIHAGIKDDPWNIRFQEKFEKTSYGALETGYIDHDPGLKFADQLIFNEDRLMRYLFNDSSTITTWNDNEWYIDDEDEITEKLHKEYYDPKTERFLDGYWDAVNWEHFNVPKDTEWKYLKGN